MKEPKPSKYLKEANVLITNLNKNSTLKIDIHFVHIFRALKLIKNCTFFLIMYYYIFSYYFNRLYFFKQRMWFLLSPHKIYKEMIE
jgi:hypothetical protein